MPKNKVNNNIKLKSGGGLLNDATDGLSVDTGTTANKLVRLDGNAKLPAVDGSLLNVSANNNLLVSIPSSNTRTDCGMSATFGPSTPTDYTKIKEITFNNVSGSIKVSFRIEYLESGATVPFAKIYKNDIAVGTERTGTMQTFSEDISVSTGDKIQIYAKVGVGNQNTFRINMIYLQYDISLKQNYISNVVNL